MLDLGAAMHHALHQNPKSQQTQNDTGEFSVHSPSHRFKRFPRANPSNVKRKACTAMRTMVSTTGSPINPIENPTASVLGEAATRA